MPDSIPTGNPLDLPLITAAVRNAKFPSTARNAQVIVFDGSNPNADIYRMLVSEFVKPTIDSQSGAGAISLFTDLTKLTTTGADALTLADGVDGQSKQIVMVTDGGDGTLTPATKTGYSTITFNDAGDTVTLLFTTTKGWLIMSNNGCTVA